MRQALSKILFPKGYFFGGKTYGVQGDPARHLLMIGTVGMVAPKDRPMRILEVGSWIGFSALSWAQAIATFAPHKGTLLCVDPWTSYFKEADLRSGNETYEAMDFMGRSGLAYDLFCHNVQFAAPGVRVDHNRGVAADILPYLAPESFDIIYIDGSHYYDDVLSDLKLADRLLRDGGVLCGDDLELQAGECDLAVAERSKSVDYIQDPKSGATYHPGVTLAVNEFFGPVSALRGYWCMRKAAAGYQPVEFGASPVFVPDHFPDDFKAQCERILGLRT